MAAAAERPRTVMESWIIDGEIRQCITDSPEYGDVTLGWVCNLVSVLQYLRRFCGASKCAIS